MSRTDHHCIENTSLATTRVPLCLHLPLASGGEVWSLSHADHIGLEHRVQRENTDIFKKLNVLHVPSQSVSKQHGRAASSREGTSNSLELPLSVVEFINL